MSAFDFDVIGDVPPHKPMPPRPIAAQTDGARIRARPPPGAPRRSRTEARRGLQPAARGDRRPDRRAGNCARDELSRNQGAAVLR